LATLSAPSLFYEVDGSGELPSLMFPTQGEKKKKKAHSRKVVKHKQQQQGGKSWSQPSEMYLNTEKVIRRAKCGGSGKRGEEAKLSEAYGGASLVQARRSYPFEALKTDEDRVLLKEGAYCLQCAEKTEREGGVGKKEGAEV